MQFKVWDTIEAGRWCARALDKSSPFVKQAGGDWKKKLLFPFENICWKHLRTDNGEKPSVTFVFFGFEKIWEVSSNWAESKDSSRLANRSAEPSVEWTILSIVEKAAIWASSEWAERRCRWRNGWELGTKQLSCLWFPFFKWPTLSIHFFNRLSSKVANLPKIEWMALKFVFHLPFSFYAIQQKAETAGVCESPFYHSFMEFYSATPPI